jgi:hypothetical protein
MSQMSTPQMKRASGGVDVYTGLLAVAFLVLAAGVGLLVKRNIDHSATDGQDGGPVKLVLSR